MALRKIINTQGLGFVKTPYELPLLFTLLK